MTGHTTTSTPPGAGAGREGLDARYGRTGQKRRRDRTIAWVGAIAFVIVFAAWVVWVAFDGTGDTIGSRDIGHKVIDDRTVSISYDVSMPPGTTAKCALQVQNDTHNIVGWKVVDIPASDSYTQAFTDTVRTTQLGVTGLIYRCWLA
ncbi:MAG TPA: DUF4307 domain-containing protein [Homoserinimonas sp.]|nr:DUF4307 domain-containing protein [Homoserinimonas sp.]